MNILLVAPVPPSPAAALAIPRILHAQLAGLSERHRVTVAVVAGPEEPELEAVDRLRREGVDLHAVCRHEPRGAGERWNRRRRLAWGWGGRRLPWRSVWYHDHGLQAVLDRLYAERRFDLVAVEDNAAAPYRFDPSMPTVFTEHEVRRPRPLRFRTSPRAALSELDWRRWPGYHRATWPKFDLIQAFTERDAESIRTMCPRVADRVRVNPFGAELPPALAPSAAGSRELLFAGNFTHPPNVDAALWLGTEIVPQLRSRGVAARLTVVGPAAPEEIRGLAGPDVSVLGEVPDLRPHLESAAVVLAPVRTGGGMRMKVLEAMAAGRPVVTTTRGAEGYEAAVGGALAVADSTAGIVDAVEALLEDPAGRTAMGERARAYAVENHGVEAYARRLERVYEEALRRRRTGGGR